MVTNNRSRNGAKAKETSRPVYAKKYWTGSGQLEVAVWSRMIGEGDDAREVMNTTIKKTYLADGEYKESSSYRPEELGLIAFALQDAFQFIANMANKE